uniref:Enolase C-terminal domain-containing protein n=1 Tax=uncultured planctomycete 8FN TaxID=455070 RepID=A9LH10_9BACT|nr:hypothetical protein 8FN_9 [uncultured planctomycete 8FN]
MVTRFQIKDIATSQEKFKYRSPMKFGGRVVEDVVVYHVDVVIEDDNGRQSTGHGSMTMGNLWAWPSSVVAADLTLATMLELADLICQSAGELGRYEHPVRMLVDFEHSFPEIALTLEKNNALAETIPRLAQLVCGSPLDAAVHDAFGRLHQLNSFQTLTPSLLREDLSCFLDESFGGCYLSSYVLEKPQANMPLYHLVGALDPIFGDGAKVESESDFPELLGDWIRRDGLTHLKIKLSGDDFDWDVERVMDIDAASRTVQLDMGRSTWSYSLDFNEKCASIDYVVDFLELIRTRNPDCFSRIQYVEQPTHRDLKKNPQNTVHKAAKIKPVVIDESLIDLESLLLARDQGYSGIALKACKGQTGSLLMAAAAQKLEMFLCVQDLTCIGHNFLHSASLAAHIPTVAAIEGNGRQYCPLGNQQWAQQYPEVFQPVEGRIATQELNGLGLGF